MLRVKCFASIKAETFVAVQECDARMLNSIIKAGSIITY